MTKHVLNYFQKHWHKPAITVEIGRHKVALGEGEPVAQVVFRKPALARRLLVNPSMAIGEGYMRGDIEISGNLLGLLEGYYRMVMAGRSSSAMQMLNTIRGWLASQPISASKAKANARAHYNVGNEFYQLWLDPLMVYTCAYFPEGNEDLATAQERKLDLVCQKAQLKPGQHVIDLGCGWGGLLMYAAQHYGVTGVGVVAAEEQGVYAREEIARRGLSDKIEIVIDDWRAAKGSYDRVLSVGMMEHVGLQQYGHFFKLIRSLLKRGGFAFVHTIGVLHAAPTDPWIAKYIFPGGRFPTIGDIIAGGAEQGLFPIHEEDLRPHYAKTLRHWSEGFEHSLDQVRQMDVGMDTEEFIRMWRLYLLGSEAAFRWGGLHLWQVVFADEKTNVPMRWNFKLN